jgi:hypothetical protein
MRATEQQQAMLLRRTHSRLERLALQLGHQAAGRPKHSMRFRLPARV